MAAGSVQNFFHVGIDVKSPSQKQQDLQQRFKTTSQKIVSIRIRR